MFGSYNEVKIMVEVKKEALAKCGDKIRDIINYVRVKQKEDVEVEGGATRINEKTAERLVVQLEELADMMGQASGGVVEPKMKGHKHT